MNIQNKLVYGVGINDADYKVFLYKDYKCVWRCPFYSRWHFMLTRCYNQKYQKQFPSYAGCEVSIEWLTFSSFKAWMEKQQWEGRELDKDLLAPGNKIYSAETCVFLDGATNSFLTNTSPEKQGLPRGVLTRNGRYSARCSVNGVQIHLGVFDTAEEAHAAWLSKKLEQARVLASRQSDPRVAAALIKRYESHDQ